MKKEFQEQVNDWMHICFGPELSKDKTERNHRFLEEALELVQSLECSRSEAHQIVDYVFNRPTGVPYQECGGVMVTLAALATVASLNMSKCGQDELERIWENIWQIQTKQQSKPKILSSAPLNCRISLSYKRNNK